MWKKQFYIYTQSSLVPGVLLQMQRKHEADKWGNYYANLDSMMLPNEYLLKLLVASYPEKEDYMGGKSWREAFEGRKCLDLGCGDGRNCVLINKLGMQLYATEISDLICRKVTRNLESMGIALCRKNIRTGFNNQIPFERNTFDVLVSWNGIYYLDNPEQDILENFCEVSRVMKPDALFVCSLPASKCYSLTGSLKVGKFTRQIAPSKLHDWGGGLQDGSYYYRFDSKEHLVSNLSAYFKEIRVSELYWDGFGAPLHYYIFSALNK